MKWIFASLLFLTSSVGYRKSGTAAADEKPRDQLPVQKTINISFEGYDRSFIIYLPLGYNNAGKMPMVFVIHEEAGTRKE